MKVIKYFCTGFLGCIAIIITISGSIAFGMQRHKENNFIENCCLVIDTIAMQHGCSENICYAAIWTIEYNDTTITLNTSRIRVRITGSYYAKYAAAMDELEKYPVSRTHCTFFCQYCANIFFRLALHTHVTMTNERPGKLPSGKNPTRNLV
jgi:hypothetical protein